MTPEQIERVFGRGRLQMVTGAHVEVFREAAAPGESRRYTKRFLTTAEGDYAQWTEREWRILARLIGHGTRCVPDVVQFDRDARGTKLVQTYDAGATVDQWATLLPVERDGRVYGHVFEDCAHWWALAHHCLVALDEIHTLGLVHLDVKGDNICIPIGPPTFSPAVPSQRMVAAFHKLALIDFAFSLVSGEALTTPLPIGWQPDYDYQSPRLLHALEAGRNGDLGPTEALDWRCDIYSLAAMLQRYLPREPVTECDDGWTAQRCAAATALIARLREAHDLAPSVRRPHADLIAQTSAELRATPLMESVERGWSLAHAAQPTAVPVVPLTPITRLAPPLRVVIPPRDDIAFARSRSAAPQRPAAGASEPPGFRRPMLAAIAVLLIGIAAALVNDVPLVSHAVQRVIDSGRAIGAALRDGLRPDSDVPRVAAAEPPAEAPVATPATEPPVAVEPAASKPTPEPTSPSSHEPFRALAPPSTPMAASPSDGRSFADQIEAFRSKSVPRSTSAARAPSTRTGTSTPAASGRSAAVATQPAPIVKPARRVAAGTPVKRVPQPLATKRTNNAVVASSPPQPRVPLVARVSTTASPSAPSVAPSASAPSTAVAAVATAPAPAIDPPASAAVTFPVAPPIEIPRAITVPNPAPAPPATIASVEPQRGFPAPPPPRESQPPSAAAAPQALPPAGERRDAFDYLAQAQRMLVTLVPRTSAQTYMRLARALSYAAGARHPAQDRAVIDAVLAVDVAKESMFVAIEIAPVDARRLHEEARSAYWTRRHVPEAMDLALRAFGANPYDPEIAGTLAFLHLRVVPSQPERARQLALHAIGLRSAQHSGGRAEDWTNFAIASALTGRLADARDALYASHTLARNLDRSCRAAIGALATFGERVREPVAALLDRLDAQGRADDSPYCAWPQARSANRP